MKKSVKKLLSLTLTLALGVTLVLRGKQAQGLRVKIRL